MRMKMLIRKKRPRRLRKSRRNISMKKN